MGALRERMLREMQLRQFSAKTQTGYLTTLTDLVRGVNYFRVSATTISAGPGR